MRDFFYNLREKEFLDISSFGTSIGEKRRVEDM